MSAGSTVSSKLRIAGVAAGLAFAASAHADSVGPYAWPLSEDAGPTSTFGEYRSGRFHMGLDLSTRGQVGLPIRAVGDGDILRVRASGVGYGRAIYLKLDDGPLVVYAHLDDYYAPLAAYVASEQKRLGRYEVDLYPEKGRFRVERGDVIGATGDSGAGAPHLHFEWRNDVGDVAVNPFHVGFRVSDTRPPVIRDVEVWPATPWGLVAGLGERGRFRAVTVGPGEFRCDTVDVVGDVALSAHVFDYADDRPLPLAIHAIAVRVGERTVFETRLDSLGYANQRDADLVYDPGRAGNGDPRVRRLFAVPGDRSGCHVDGAGVIEDPRHGEVGVWPNAVVTIVDVLATDYWGNVSRLQVPLRFGGHPIDSAPPPPGYATGAAPRPLLVADVHDGYDHAGVVFVVPTDIASIDGASVVTASGRASVPAYVAPAEGGAWVARFDPAGLTGAVRVDVTGRTDTGARVVLRTPPTLEIGAPGAARVVDLGGATLELGGDSLFDDAVLHASWQDSVPDVEPVLGIASPRLRLSPNDRVFRRSASLWLSPPRDADPTRLGLYGYLPRSRRWVFLGNGEREGRIGGGIRGLGEFCLLADEVPPRVLRTWPKDGETVTTPTPRVAVRIMDVGSGVGWSSMSLAVDGETAIAEWDPEDGVLRVHGMAPLAAGEHTVSIVVSDACGNETTLTYSFRVRGA